MPITDMMLMVLPVSKQGEQGADHGRRQGEHDGEGVEQRVELAGQQHVDDEDRQADGEEQRVHRLGELLGLAGGLGVVALGQLLGEDRVARSPGRG